ncbi:MAG: hypothetical protein QG607_381 [Patescibacteria group bacterium]|nr:hypothetical protein [Patescibacteria group bacterium]
MPTVENESPEAKIARLEKESFTHMTNFNELAHQIRAIGKEMSGRLDDRIFLTQQIDRLKKIPLDMIHGKHSFEFYDKP